MDLPQTAHPRRVLVTGACGFVGQHLVRALHDAGHDVLGTVFASRPELYKNVSYATLNISNLDMLVSIATSFRPQAIIHLAGISFVPAADRDISTTMQVNVAGSLNVARVSARIGARMLFISSGDIYGKISPDKLPVDESCPPKPENIYSISKLLSEMGILELSRFEQCEVVVARPFNHIGVGQSSRFVVPSFASQIARASESGGEAKIFVGNLDAKRDFTDVRDVVEAYRLMLDVPPGTYNICSGKAVAIQEILDIFMSFAGTSVQVERDPKRMRPSDVPEIRGSYRALHAVSGWSPTIPLQETLREVFECELQKVRAGIRSCLSTKGEGYEET